MASSAILLRRLTPSTKMLEVIQQVLRYAPQAGKYLVLLLFVLNVGSWPLVWHFRVFAAVIKVRTQLAFLRLTHTFSSKKRTDAAFDAWFEARLPIGQHPFRTRWYYTSWVSLDDGDFNLHMSNSSYAKILDTARFRLALKAFPNLFRCGAWIALAATHYHFIREIPLFARYEVRTNIGAWDGKWVSVLDISIRVLLRSPPPPKNQNPNPTKKNTAPAHHHPHTTENLLHLHLPSLKTPATPLESGAGTPTEFTRLERGIANTESGVTNGMPNGTQNGHGSQDPDAISRALLARAKAAQEEEEDGAVVYTIIVSQLCFKHGRITIPPALVLAANGFYAGPAESLANPNSNMNSNADTNTTLNSNADTGRTKREAPPHWPTVRALTRQSTSTPSKRLPALTALFRGGWRSVDGAAPSASTSGSAETGAGEGAGADAGGRWWEAALAGCEAERRGRLVPFVGAESAVRVSDGGERTGGLCGGLEGVRGLKA
ncbi:hypothetical protein B0H11DRAFT_2103477 [Mycena galericulata]|nr:hypothetical protein B0H11DRAFT_2103477 [Mycena galericulata]